MNSLLLIVGVAAGFALFGFLFVECVTILEVWADPPAALGPVKPTLVDVIEMRLGYYRELFGRIC